MKYTRKALPVKVIIRRDGIMQPYHVRVSVTRAQKEKGEAITKEEQSEYLHSQLKEKQSKEILAKQKKILSHAEDVDHKYVNNLTLKLVENELTPMMRKAFRKLKNGDVGHQVELSELTIDDIKEFIEERKKLRDDRKEKGRRTTQDDKLIANLERALKLIEKDLGPKGKIPGLTVLAPLSRKTLNATMQHSRFISMQHREQLGGGEESEPETHRFVESAYMAFKRWKHGGIDDASLKALALVSLHMAVKRIGDQPIDAIIVPPVTRVEGERGKGKSTTELDKETKQELNERIQFRAANLLHEDVKGVASLNEFNKALEKLADSKTKDELNKISKILGYDELVGAIHSADEFKDAHDLVLDSLKKGEIDKEEYAGKVVEAARAMLKDGVISFEDYKRIVSADPEKDESALTYTPIKFDPMLLGVKEFEVKKIRGGTEGVRKPGKYALTYEAMRNHLTALLEEKYKTKIKDVNHFYELLGKHIRDTYGEDTKNIMLLDDNIDSGATQAVLAQFLSKAGFNVIPVALYNMKGTYGQVQVDKATKAAIKEWRQLRGQNTQAEVPESMHEKEPADASELKGKEIYKRLKPRKVKEQYYNKSKFLVPKINQQRS